MNRVLTIRGSIPGRRNIFFYLSEIVQTYCVLWSLPSLLFSRNGCSCLRLKQKTYGFDRSSISRAEGKYKSSYTSSAPTYPPAYLYGGIGKPLANLSWKAVR